jgi:hypothetical protein
MMSFGSVVAAVLIAILKFKPEQTERESVAPMGKAAGLG